MQTGMILTVILASVLLIFQNCQTNEIAVKQEKPLRDINEVMKDHTEELMALPGVVGIYIGKTSDDQLCMRVMVAKKTRELRKQIHKAFEGHPVEIEVSGVIRPLENR